MYNYFMLIGYSIKDVELREVNGKKVCTITLSVKREFQNMDGQYESDLISITAWEFLAEHAAQYVKKGSRIAVKGRINPQKKTIGDQIVYTNELNADRLIFCGSSTSSAPTSPTE